MKSECYHFEVHGGEVIEKGKPYWPNQLTLEMDTFHAFDLMSQILAQLRDGKKIISVTRCGALDHTETPDL